MSVPITVEAHTRHDHLRVTLDGERSALEASVAAWHEIADHVARHHAARVLVLNRLVGTLPTPDEQRRIVESLAARGFRGIRIAIVMADSRHIDGLEHGALDGIDVGQQVSIFASEELAVLWLCHGE